MTKTQSSMPNAATEAVATLLRQSSAATASETRQSTATSPINPSQLQELTSGSSQLLSRLQSFLPQIASSNKELALRRGTEGELESLVTVEEKELESEPEVSSAVTWVDLAGSISRDSENSSCSSTSESESGSEDEDDSDESSSFSEAKAETDNVAKCTQRTDSSAGAHMIEMNIGVGVFDIDPDFNTSTLSTQVPVISGTRDSPGPQKKKQGKLMIEELP